MSFLNPEDRTALDALAKFLHDHPSWNAEFGYLPWEGGRWLCRLIHVGPGREPDTCPYAERRSLEQAIATVLGRFFVDYKNDKG